MVNVVPTPFHSPLIPTSLLIAAISLQKPALSLGSTNVEYMLPPLLILFNASSSVTASPQIPAHLVGKLHPVGAGAGSAGTVNEENAARVPREIRAAGYSSTLVRQVNGFFLPGGARRGVNNDVWQHSAEGAVGGAVLNGSGWTV